MTTGSIRSPLGSWVGGLSAHPTVSQAGLRSMAAFWMGGVSNAGTTPPAPSVVLLGGKDYPTHGIQHEKDYHFHSPYEEFKEGKYKLELLHVEKEIAEAETRRLAALKRSKSKLLAEKATIRLAKQERELLEQINVLRIERERLMRLIDDDEAILILMMSFPLH